MDGVAVETFVPNLHVGAKRVDGGKILNREADRFRRRGEATITESLRTAFASCHEQFGWHFDSRISCYRLRWPRAELSVARLLVNDRASAHVDEVIISQ